MIRRHQNLLPYLAPFGAWALFFWRFAAPSPADRVTYPAGDFTQQFGVFLVHRVEAIPDDAALYTRLADPGFDPFSTAILPRAVDVSLGGGDSVVVALDLSGRLRLHTTSGADAVLVVSEAHFPGWRVTVDGRPAPLLRADGALLAVAVRVPSGAHEVEFVYRPEALLIGGVISALALLFAFGLVVGDRRFAR